MSLFFLFSPDKSLSPQLLLSLSASILLHPRSIQTSAMGNPFAEFTGPERRNIIIYVLGIMLYKFGLVRHISF